MTEISCMFCSSQFTKQCSLDRHYKDNRCKTLKEWSQYQIYEYIKKCTGVHVLVNSQQNIFNIKVEVQVNPLRNTKDETFDFELYRQAIRDMRNELNKSNVKRALSSVLQNDILNNIQMKLTVSDEPIETMQIH